MHSFDASQTFWEKYGARNEHLRKELGYFSIENIDDSSFVTVAVNPKKHFGDFESQSVNKKLKGLRKGQVGWNLKTV